LFISAGVYKRQAFVKHLPNAYRFTYAYSPQLALVFALVTENTNHKCYFSPELLIEWEPPAEEIAWNQQLFNYGAPYIAEAIPSINLRDKLLMKMRMVADIAPSLTLRKILSSSQKKDIQLISIQRQYYILASLTPSYSTHAFIAHLLVLASGHRGFVKLIRIIERVSNSRFAFTARAAKSLLDTQLLSKDIKLPLKNIVH